MHSLIQENAVYILWIALFVVCWFCFCFVFVFWGLFGFLLFLFLFCCFCSFAVILQSSTLRNRLIKDAQEDKKTQNLNVDTKKRRSEFTFFFTCFNVHKRDIDFFSKKVCLKFKKDLLIASYFICYHIDTCELFSVKSKCEDKSYNIDVLLFLSFYNFFCISDAAIIVFSYFYC